MLADKYDVVFNLLSGIAAFGAAFLWIRSATISVVYDPNGVADADGWHSAALTKTKDGVEIDIVATLGAANKWNSYAAYTASVAAFAQVLAAVL